MRRALAAALAAVITACSSGPGVDEVVPPPPPAPGEPVNPLVTDTSLPSDPVTDTTG